MGEADQWDAEFLQAQLIFPSLIPPESEIIISLIQVSQHQYEHLDNRKKKHFTGSNPVLVSSQVSLLIPTFHQNLTINLEKFSTITFSYRQNIPHYHRKLAKNMEHQLFA